MVAGTGSVAAQSSSPDGLEAADEIYVEDDGDAVLVYRDQQAGDSSGSVEFGADIGADLAYLFATQPRAGQGDTTGNLTAILTGSELSANGSLSAPKPDALQALTVDLSGETTSQNSVLNALLGAEFDVPPSAALLQSVSVSSNLSTTPSDLTSAGQASVQLAQPLPVSTSVDFTLTETDGTYTLDAAEQRSVENPADWDSRSNASATLSEQFGASGQLGTFASVTIDSYSFDSTTSRLDIEYTVTYQNVESIGTNLLASQLASSPEVDLTQAEADRIASDIQELSIQEASISFEVGGQQASANYRIDVDNYDSAVFAALDIADATDLDAATTAQVDRTRSRLEAQQAAGLERNVDFSAQYNILGSTTASVNTTVSSETTNWAAYVQELRDRGIETEENSFDLSATTTDGEIVADVSASLSGENLVDSGMIGSPENLDPETRELLEAAGDAELEQSRLSVGLAETEVTTGAAARFGNLTAVRDALASAGAIPATLRSIVGQTENDQVATYITVGGAVQSGATESDVRALAYVDSETQVNLPGTWDEQFPALDTQRANGILDGDDSGDGSGDGSGGGTGGLDVGIELQQSASVAQGGSVDISAFPNNRAGQSVSGTLELAVDQNGDGQFGTGEVVASKQVSLAAGDSREEVLTYSNVGLAPGEYTYRAQLRSGGQTVTSFTTSTLTVEGGEPRLVLEPQPASTTTNATTTLDLTLANADGGVGTYDNISVSVGDTSVASITGVSDATGAGASVQTVAADGSSATIAANFGGDTADTGDVTVATVTLDTAATAGTTALDVSLDGDVFDEAGSVYTLAEVRGGQLTVREGGPEILPATPSADTDGDGRIDDLNGNGEIDRGDAQALFANLGTQRVSENAALLDYNGNGGVDRGDVQALFQRAQQ